MINLLPSDHKKSISRELRIRAISSWFMMFSVVFLSLSIISVPAFILQRTEKKLVEIETLATINNFDGVSTESLLSQITEINKSNLENLTKLTPSGVFLDMFKIALEPDTQNIKIEQIFLGKNESSLFIKIIGTSDSRESLLSYSTSLKNSGSCKDFSTPVSSLTKSQDIDFIIDCYLKEKEN